MEVSDWVEVGIVKYIAKDEDEMNLLFKELHSQGVFKNKHTVSIEEPIEVEGYIHMQNISMIRSDGIGLKMTPDDVKDLKRNQLEIQKMSVEDKVCFVKEVLKNLPNFENENEMYYWVGEEDFKLYKKSLGLD